MSFFGATGTPVLEQRLGFKVGCLIRIAEVNIMYVPRDPPLVATLADLLVAGAQPVLFPHTVAEVRLPGFELMLSEYL